MKKLENLGTPRSQKHKFEVPKTSSQSDQRSPKLEWIDHCVWSAPNPMHTAGDVFVNYRVAYCLSSSSSLHVARLKAPTFEPIRNAHCFYTKGYGADSHVALGSRFIESSSAGEVGGRGGSL